MDFIYSTRLQLFTSLPSNGAKHRLEQHNIELHCVGDVGGVDRFILNEVRNAVRFVQLDRRSRWEVDIRR